MKKLSIILLMLAVACGAMLSSAFVKDQKLSVTQYQDFGWPARPIAK